MEHKLVFRKLYNLGQRGGAPGKRIRSARAALFTGTSATINVIEVALTILGIWLGGRRVGAEEKGPFYAQGVVISCIRKGHGHGQRGDVPEKRIHSDQAALSSGASATNNGNDVALFLF